MIRRGNVVFDPPYPPFFAEDLTSLLIDCNGITIPPRDDKDIIAIFFTQLTPKSHGTALRLLRSRDQLNPAVRSISSQPRLNVSSCHHG